MKFGICGPIERIPLLKPGTIDYAELALFNVHGMTGEDIKKAKEILKTAGISVETTNGFFPETVRLCGKDYSRQAVIDYCKIALPKAKELGVETCVLGSSCSRNIPDGENRADCLKQLDESFRTVGECAAEYSINVAIEPLNRDESNVINSVAEGAEMCRRIAHPNVTVLADFFHVTKENEPLENIYHNRDILTHTHIARPGKRTVPQPDDGYDYTPIANALKKAGYDKRMSIEGMWDGDFTELATTATAYLRQIFA